MMPTTMPNGGMIIEIAQARSEDHQHEADDHRGSVLKETENPSQRDCV